METEKAMTWQQLETLRWLQCRTTSLHIHPHSGNATIRHGDRTMAIIAPDGQVKFGYTFPNGTYVAPERLTFENPHDRENH